MEQLLESEKGLEDVMMKNMPKEWVRFKFGLEFRQLKFTLKQNEEEQFFQVVLDQMVLGATVGGLNWIDVDFSISDFFIADLYSQSKVFPYLVESVFNEKSA